MTDEDSTFTKEHWKLFLNLVAGFNGKRAFELALKAVEETLRRVIDRTENKK